jgi:predicted nucleotidyltransferase
MKEYTQSSEFGMVRVMLDLAQRVADQLVQIDGVVAVVLGGSWARGTAQPGSDVDIGIYYRAAQPPSLAALQQLAQQLDDRHLPELLTGFGGWGPWINGGGWLTINAQPVDWLYRDLDRVAAVLEACCAGQPTLDHQPGHPHGFHSHIYLGELFFAARCTIPMACLPRSKPRSRRIRRCSNQH